MLIIFLIHPVPALMTQSHLPGQAPKLDLTMLTALNPQSNQTNPLVHGHGGIPGVIVDSIGGPLDHQRAQQQAALQLYQMQTPYTAPQPAQQQQQTQTNQEMQQLLRSASSNGYSSTNPPGVLSGGILLLTGTPVDASSEELSSIFLSITHLLTVSVISSVLILWRLI